MSCNCQAQIEEQAAQIEQLRHELHREQSASTQLQGIVRDQAEDIRRLRAHGYKGPLEAVKMQVDPL